MIQLLQGLFFLKTFNWISNGMILKTINQHVFFTRLCCQKLQNRVAEEFQSRISEIKLSIFCLPLSWSQREDKDLWAQGPSINHPALWGQLDSDEKVL